MANNLRVFNTNSEYQSADLILPAVSYVAETDKVIYDMAAPVQSKWKATYSDGSTTSAECDSSSEIVGGEIDVTDLVSVEIGDCVDTIGDDAFGGGGSLTSIVIPSGVTSIGDYAFNSCSSLTSIDIPSGVTSIGSGTFSNCSSLTSIDIPSGVTSIGDYAFYHCTSLASLTVEATTPPTLGTQVFGGHNNLKKIYVPSASVEAYRAANGWRSFGLRIQPIP